MKHNNSQIIGIPEGEEKEQGIKIQFEKIMRENFPIMERGTEHSSSGSTESPSQDE